jgi:HEAT repeat protein
VRLLDRPDQHPAVLAAAARALAALDARAAAPAFLKLANSGDPDLCEVVEPALARWDHAPARDVWLDRLARPRTHARSLLLAVECLGTVREERAAARLRELALSPDAAPPVRLAAARALGEIRTSGSEADAARLAGDTSSRGTVGRLVAASLLRRHGGDEAVRLLQKLAADAEPAVAAVAVARLAEIDTKHVLTVLAAVLASPDAEVRVHGVDAMFRHPSDEHVRSLARAMSDPHPDVRVRARRHLRELAGANWRAAVIDRGTQALAAADWRGQEQAAILLAQLDHKPAAARLVELLKSNRSEVLVAVGWALRLLAVAETLPEVLDHVRQRHAEMLRSGPTAGLRGVSAEALDLHLSHLVQFLGQSRHRPADGSLRALVPRFIKRGIPPVFVPVGPETRAAAIWALGLLHEGKPDEALAAQIEDRLTPDGMFGFDDERVRRMAAVSLARMQAKQSLPVLREWSSGKAPSMDVVANACRWSVGRLTGEPVPASGTIEVPQRDWFLAPAK